MEKHTLDGFADEMMKISKEDGINMKRLIGANVLAGLGVGFGKGYTEEKVLSALAKLRPSMSSARKLGIARGLTSAGSGVLYGLATAYGLKKKKKK